MKENRADDLVAEPVDGGSMPQGAAMRVALRQVAATTVSHDTALDLELGMEIDSICQRFEQEICHGGCPRIEDYCVENESVAARLLVELVALELEYRRKRDPSYRPDPAEYHARFPADPRAIDAAIATFHELYRIPAERRIGPYELLEELGRGGQGIVYRALHEGLVGAEHLVALKVILPARVGSYRDVARFVNEVKSMVRLNHRGVLPVFDSGEDRGRPFVAMKLVGPSLERLVAAKGTIPAPESARLVAEIARAVDYLHQHDIAHCDLKPSNILLDGDQPLITDFGLSRVLKGESGTESAGGLGIEGTIPYMAPEQIRGDPGKASDIYALGVLLLELLTGETPFGKGRAALNRILDNEAPGPRQFDSSVPDALDRIVRKCLRKDPAGRYGSAAQVAAELERFRRKEPLVHTPADTRLQSLYLWTRRHRELTCRLIGLSSILLLTQFNYFCVLKAADRDLWLHIRVSCVEALWIIASFVFDRLSWKEGPNEPLRPVWIAIDVTLLTCLLGVLNAVSTAYVIGYPLLMAISGLWARVRLVWLTTFLCIAGYLVLVLDANHRQGLPLTTGTRVHDPIGVLAIMLIAGYVIAAQTERARALGEVSAPRY